MIEARTRGAAQKRQDILIFIATYRSNHKYSPSLRDISDYFATSTSVISSDLQALRDQGLLTWTPTVARTILLTDAAYDLIRKIK